MQRTLLALAVLALVGAIFAAAAAEDYSASKTRSNVIKVKVSILRKNATSSDASTFIKVDGIYMSLATCKLLHQNQDVCRNATVTTAPSVVIYPKADTSTAIVRTAAQCAWAREKDWQQQVWAQYPNLDPSTTGPGKEQFLDNAATGSLSYQYQCLRGTISQ